MQKSLCSQGLDCIFQLPASMATAWPDLTSIEQSSSRKTARPPFSVAPSSLTDFKLSSRKADDYVHMWHMRIRLPSGKRSKETREVERKIAPGIVAALMLHELNAAQHAALINR